MHIYIYTHILCRHNISITYTQHNNTQHQTTKTLNSTFVLYVYVCMYIYIEREMYMYTCVYTYIYTPIYIYIYIYINTVWHGSKLSFCSLSLGLWICACITCPEKHVGFDTASHLII